MSGTQAESQLVELNVGGVFYSTSLSTLTSESGSKLDQMFNNQDSILKDSKVWLLFEPVIWTFFIWFLIFLTLGQIFHRPWWRPFPIYFGLLTQQEIGVTRKLSGNAKIGHGSGLLPITKVGTHFLSIFPRYQSSCHNLFYLFSMECSLEFRDGIHITKVQDSLGNSTLLLF